MRAVIQRVTHASVTIDGVVKGKIGQGFLVLFGAGEGDTPAQAELLAKKTAGMRIFCDDEGRMNRSLADVGGSVLVISQFTLYADCRKGNRPSFIRAGKPEHADPLYEYMLKSCAAMLPGVKVERGIFGADMKITLLNDGPFTVILDSEELFRPRNS